MNWFELKFSRSSEFKARKALLLNTVSLFCDISRFFRLLNEAKVPPRRYER